MSESSIRTPRSKALDIARDFCAMVAPYCQEVHVAGSLRRERPDVGDIEIVAVPRRAEAPSAVQAGMFSDAPVVRQGGEDMLDMFLNLSLQNGFVQKRLVNGHPFWGQKNKRLTYHGAPFDLYGAAAGQLGVILAIRTGPAAYSNALVTSSDLVTRSGRRGLLPPHLRIAEGFWLIQRDTERRVPCPDETTFFAALGLPWPEPRTRV